MQKPCICAMQINNALKALALTCVSGPGDRGAVQGHYGHQPHFWTEIMGMLWVTQPSIIPAQRPPPAKKYLKYLKI